MERTFIVEAFVIHFSRPIHRLYTASCILYNLVFVVHQIGASKLHADLSEVGAWNRSTPLPHLPASSWHRHHSTIWLKHQDLGCINYAFHQTHVNYHTWVLLLWYWRQWQISRNSTELLQAPLCKLSIDAVPGPGYMNLTNGLASGNCEATVLGLPSCHLTCLISWRHSDISRLHTGPTVVQHIFD